MDYIDILKRGLKTTWRYKILWLFGLFAGGAAGGNFNYNMPGGSSRTGSTGTGATAAQLQTLYRQFLTQIERYLPVIIAVGVVFILLGILSFILTFAAKGGLVHLVNEAEEGRPVHGGDGWRVGFSKWGRIFLIDLLISLPVIIVAVVFAMIFGASIAGLVVAGRGAQGAAAAAGMIGGLSGLFCVSALLVVALAAYGVIVGTAGQLALRYAVLEDRTAVESLKQGWADVWAKRGAVVMLVAVWASGMVFGIALGIVAVMLVLPGVGLIVVGSYAAAAVVFVIDVILLTVPSAAFAAFGSASWTVFFRRMTGREVPATVAPAYVPAPPVYAPAAPPMPAPPASPVYAPTAPPAPAEPAPEPTAPPAPAEPAPEPTAPPAPEPPVGVQ